MFPYFQALSMTAPIRYVSPDVERVANPALRVRQTGADKSSRRMARPVLTQFPACRLHVSLLGNRLNKGIRGLDGRSEKRIPVGAEVFGGPVTDAKAIVPWGGRTGKCDSSMVPS
jgi:hypothetical protein